MTYARARRAARRIYTATYARAARVFERLARAHRSACVRRRERSPRRAVAARDACAPSLRRAHVCTSKAPRPEPSSRRARFHLDRFHFFHFRSCDDKYIG